MWYGGSRSRGSRFRDEGGAALPWRPYVDIVGANIAASDDAANGKTVLTVSGSSGGTSIPGIFNVQDYGAVPGGGDDTAAIQAAQNAAAAYAATKGATGTVLFPPGSYTISSPIDWDSPSNVVTPAIPWIGLGGPGSVFIYYTGASGSRMLNVSHLNENYEGHHYFRGLTFIGGGWNAGQTCIVLTDRSAGLAGGVEDQGGNALTIIEDCNFFGWDTAIRGYGALVNYFHHLQIESVKVGINLSTSHYPPGSNQNIIRDCRIVPAASASPWSSPAGSCVIVEGGSGTLIDGCNFEYYGAGSTEAAVIFGQGADGQRPNVMSNCWCESANAGRAVILKLGCSMTIIERNLLAGGVIQIDSGMGYPVIVQENRSAQVVNNSGGTALLRAYRNQAYARSGSSSNVIESDNFPL